MHKYFIASSAAVVASCNNDENPVFAKRIFQKNKQTFEKHYNFFWGIYLRDDYFEHDATNNSNRIVQHQKYMTNTTNNHTRLINLGKGCRKHFKASNKCLKTEVEPELETKIEPE